MEGVWGLELCEHQPELSFSVIPVLVTGIHATMLDKRQNLDVAILKRNGFR
jgi:hypothetical protein